MFNIKKIVLILPILSLFLASCANPATDTKPNGSVNSNEDNSDKTTYPVPYDDPAHTVTVSTVDDLIFYAKQGNVTILLEDGTYNVTNGIQINKNNVTIRSKSGNRDAVILKGKGMTGSVTHIFWVQSDYFALKDITISDVYYHGIQIHGELDADHLYVKNVVFRDIRQQMIKGSYDKTNRPGKHSDFGIIEDCLFEYTAGKGHYWYCGGIDIHRGENWIVRRNTFKNIVSPENRLAEGAVHFRNNAKNTIVEENIIINCGRGIMLGFDSENQYGGKIINNFIHVVRDVGIYLCNTKDVTVYNNTVYNHNSWNGSTYPNSIEYRFSQCSGIIIKNNLTNKNIISRNGASALVQTNKTGAQAAWFVNAPSGNLHLASAVPGVVNAGENLSEVTYDIDRTVRSSPYDIGADEY